MKNILYKLSKMFFFVTPQIIIIHIVLVLAILPGSVLCVGADGHFALENASKSFKCEDIAESTHYGRSQTSPLTRIYSDKGHCGPCRDIVISIDSSAKSRLKAQELSSEINAKVFSPLSIPLPALIEISTENQFPQTPPRVDPQITSLQTVILLC